MLEKLDFSKTESKDPRERQLMGEESLLQKVPCHSANSQAIEDVFYFVGYTELPSTEVDCE